MTLQQAPPVSSLPFTSPATPAQSSPTNNPSFSLVSSPPALVATLCALLQDEVARNDALPAPPLHSMSVFHALEPPSISVPDYISRVAKYVFCSDACLVFAYDYMLRSIRSHPSLALSSLSVHRLLITSVVLACKYHDDVSYNLAYYAKVGGLPTSELANLEIHMLRLLDFRLDASPLVFAALERTMISQIFVLCATNSNPAVVSLAVRARTALFDAGIAKPVPTSPISSPQSSTLVLDTCSQPCARACQSNKQSTAENSEPAQGAETSSAPCEYYNHSNCAHHTAAPSSPISSECPTDSSISRNSSMASVTEAARTDAVTCADTLHHP